MMAVLERDGVVVEVGDMLCLHTVCRRHSGHAGRSRSDGPAQGYSVLNGRDDRLLKWLDDSGIAVLIADNYAVEQAQGSMSGCVTCAVMPLHQACLFRLGIHLGELWHLTPLANWLRANKRFRFLLTAPPLRLTRSFVSPVTPVATM
jgi:hypothetical protein